MSYWDTSALVKLYVREADSSRFEALASSATRVVSSTLTRYEARAVFRRKEADAALAAGGADLLYRTLAADFADSLVEAVADSPDVEREFGRVLNACLAQSPPIFVRTLDALHLASALVAGEREFVTADIRQRAAAQFLGLSVVPV